MALLSMMMMMMMMMMMIFLVFNGSGNTVQPGMFLGLDNWSDQGIVPESCCSWEKGVHMSVDS